MLRREEVKELLPILQSFAEGKQIQDKIEGLTDWVDTDVINFKYEGQKIKHRNKPEPKYRPFKTKEECWNEMMKHQPFGWVKEISSEMPCLINAITNKNIVIMEDISSFKKALNIYEFKDGTPFGIKEESNEQ